MAEVTEKTKEPTPKLKDTPWPERPTERSESAIEPMKLGELRNSKSFLRCHGGAIASIALHPRMQGIVATASDDHTWKLFSVGQGELVMTGEGHKDWVSSISWHQNGNLIATTSGDTTVKIWDVSKEQCQHTFTDHTQATWSSAWTSDFLITGSMDHTCRLFDIGSWRSRQTFRGHVDSVNSVAFQPTNPCLICTGSGDKTLSMWDIRSGLCVQTFYGHTNAVNKVCFQKQGGNLLASCDADGLCKLWDMRTISELLQIDAGPHPANSADFDASGRVLAIASGDASVKVFDLAQKSFVKNLTAHSDSVQDVLILNHPTETVKMISAGSDSSVRLWN